ncbi:glutamate--cysteine ligase [Candidatus Peregrinibacteria bacterium]|nr:glutamate--cysteine ligase [Candidatus Peregrinibacteria bacterium]
MLNLLKLFSEKDNYLLFGESMHGLERECLRMDKEGMISMKPHPEALGSALKNSLITTDFSEAQLELISPPRNTEGATADYLKNVHTFMARNLGHEFFWPFSMPCQLPKNADKIPLADYGNSFEGKARTKYRLGLSHRYGRKMQTISGTHYNFSFSENFWKFLHVRQSRMPKSNLQNFISEQYLHLIRNFLRYSWLNTYLFGAAPVLDESYLLHKPIFGFRKPKYLKKFAKNTYYGEYACSFRMSELGYYSKVQTQHAVSFNSLKEYIADLTKAISTSEPKYKNFPGLNDHVLQKEAEHYSRIRPKQILQTKPGALAQKETPLEALSKRGILYVEARAIDINPYSPIGLDIDQLEFLHVFLVYCLFKPSPRIEECEHCRITGNQNNVSIYGRKPGLTLIKDNKEIEMKIWAREILKEMMPIAKLLNKNSKDKNHENSLLAQLDKLENPYLTPSARIVSKLKKHKQSFLEYGLELAKSHYHYFHKQKLNSKTEKEFEKIATDSLTAQKRQEMIDDTFTEDYEDLEFSTQILIKEAFKRKIHVEIIDRKENFIELSKGDHVEYVKQATKTSRDSYITFLIMENKNVTNQILEAGGLRVPKGEAFTSPEAAIAAYEKFSKIKSVIKPTTANHGIAVSFAEPEDKKSYVKAVHEAFKFGATILVEEFIDGEEYRFLVINDKTRSIVKRIPANVTGDGIHTIKELVEIKNSDPKYYKYFNTYTIKTGQTEAEHLNSQGLTFASIPPKNKRIFLRTNSNVGTGGDPIECSDSIHKSYKQLAEKAAAVAKAKICGVDMMIKNPEEQARENSKKSPANYTIIEINYNPALQMHHYPVDSEGKNVAVDVLDLLGF